MRVAMIAALAVAVLVAACAEVSTPDVSTPEPKPGARGGPGFGAGMHAGRVSGQ